MADIEFIPQELHLKPKCLISIAGLDVENNASHASVWKNFSQNRGNERAPFKLLNLPLDHEYPKPKPKVCYFVIVIINLLKHSHINNSVVSAFISQ